MDIRIFGKGFELGCGVSLQEVLDSARYRELESANAILFQSHPLGTDEGIALRAGHLNMGTLINSVSEAEALIVARCLPPMIGGIKLRPLIQIFGEELVKAAEKCLPDEVIEMATKWQTATSDEQLEMLHRLFLILRSSNQGKLGENLTMESTKKFMADKAKERDGFDAYLPKCIGKWDPDTSKAHCLGKTEMVVAFGRLAGAEVMTVNPVADVNDIISRYRIRAHKLVKDDYFTRQLKGCEPFVDSLMSTELYEQTRMIQTSFHVGAAIRLANGKWVMVDPHGIAYGLFPEVWNVSRIYDTLQKYQLVLPGLNILGHDQDTSEKLLAERFQQVEDLLQRSRTMEEKIKERVKTLPDLAQLIIESDDLDLLLRLNAEEQGQEHEPSLYQDSDARELTVYMMLTEGEMSLSKLLNPDLLEYATQEWLTFYHALASGIFLNQLQEAGLILHPVVEFSLPEYDLALSVLNSLTIDFHQDVYDDPFFNEYGYSQMALSNDLFHRKDLAMAAAKSLLCLPYRHPLCDKNLRMKGWL